MWNPMDFVEVAIKNNNDTLKFIDSIAEMQLRAN